jgi:hypothetical protein
MGENIDASLVCHAILQSKAWQQNISAPGFFVVALFN